MGRTASAGAFSSSSSLSTIWSDVTCGDTKYGPKAAFPCRYIANAYDSLRFLNLKNSILHLGNISPRCPPGQAWRWEYLPPCRWGGSARPASPQLPRNPPEESIHTHAHTALETPFRLKKKLPLEIKREREEHILPYWTGCPQGTSFQEC